MIVGEIMGSGEKKRAFWVDFAKLMAIIGVIIDHTQRVLSFNQRIAYFSYYSVSLFIILMGVTSYWSYSKNPLNGIDKIKKQFIKIIIPYIGASIVYSVYYNKCFDFKIFMDGIIHFNSCGPFYYVLLYLQLMLIAPLLFWWIERLNGKPQVIKLCFILLGFTFLLVFSSWTTNETNILDAYGGGGKLFGGTYIVLFYFGMLFGKYGEKLSLKSHMLSVAFFSISFILTVLWWLFISENQCNIDRKIQIWGNGFNPPSISFGLYAVLMATTIFLFEKVCKIGDGRLYRAFGKISLLGMHTMYIFLYHTIFYQYIIPLMYDFTGLTDNIWLKRILYFSIILFGSIAIEKGFEKIHAIIRMAYTNSYQITVN